MHDGQRIRHLLSDQVGFVFADFRTVTCRGVRPGRHPKQRVMDFVPVLCEIDLVFAGGGEDRHAVLWPNRRRDVAPGRIARSADFLPLHVVIVKIENDETLRDGFRRRWCGLGGLARRRRRRSFQGMVGTGGLDRESQNVLGLAIVEQPEVLLPEIAHRAVLVVAHHHSHRHQVALCVNSE